MRRLILGACGVTLAVVSCSNEPPQDPPVRLIAWTRVASGEHSAGRRLSGVVASALNSTVGFEVSGKISDVRVDVGDAFARGDVLGSLDRSNFILVVRQRRANVVAAQAALERAAADFDRHQALVAEGAVTQSRFDAVKAEFESTRAQVAVAEAALDLAEKSLSDTRLVAPFSGTVTARYRDPAEQVSPQTPVLSIQRSDARVEVEVDVPETFIGRLRVGTTHRVRFPALERPALDAVVSLLGTEASRSGSFPVTLVFDSPNDMIRAGMTAEVEFQAMAGASMNPRVPLAALSPGRDDGFVAFVYTAATGRIAEQAVRIRSIEGDEAVLESGLEVGDVVATRGLSFLTDGQEVRLLGEGADRFDPPQGDVAPGVDVSEEAVVLQ